MVNVLVGTILGFLAGLGVGGGSLLLLWLTLVAGLEPSAARGINLLFFLPATIISCCFRWKQGMLPWKSVLPAVLTGAIGAALGSWICGELDTQILRKAFGILLLFTGIRELCYRKK